MLRHALLHSLRFCEAEHGSSSEGPGRTSRRVWEQACGRGLLEGSLAALLCSALCCGTQPRRACGELLRDKATRLGKPASAQPAGGERGSQLHELLQHE